MTNYKKVRQLEQQHIEFLLDPKTLEEWSGKTMKERVKLFHRQYPDKRIAITSLRRLYLKHKIKRKKVVQDKVMPPHIQQNFNNQCHELLQKVNSVKDQNRKIIYLDETVFSKLSLMNKEWSPKNSNLFVDSRQVYTGYRCAIASMSAEKALN